MDYEAQVIDAFPELDEITDERLRTKVIQVWVDALEASDFDTLTDVPRSWTDPEEVNATLVPHIREATRCAIVLTDTLSELHDHDLDRDGIVATALVHDVSKLIEMSEEGFNDLIQHPHYAVHLLAAAGFPPEYQHIVLSHSTNTAVEPQTFEARIVEIGDRIATDSLWWTTTDQIKWHKRGV